MLVKSVKVGFGETRTANFQACYVEVWLEADLEGESAEEAQLVLESRCKSMVDEAFERHEIERLRRIVDGQKTVS